MTKGVQVQVISSWMEAKRGSKPSWLWSSLLEGKKLIQDGIYPMKCGKWRGD